MRRIPSVYKINKIVEQQRKKTVDEMVERAKINEQSGAPSPSELYSSGAVIKNAMSNFQKLSNNIQMAMSYYRNDQEPRYIDIAKNDSYLTKAKTIAPILLKIAGKASPKVQSGTDLMKETVKLDKERFSYTVNREKIASSYERLFEGIRAFQTSSSAVAFDIEAFSGKKNTGFDALDKIQEYSFVFHTRDKNGKFVRDNEHSINTLIGLTSDEAAAYKKMFSNDEWYLKGYDNSEQMKVIAGRLAKIGKMKYQENPSKPGMFDVTYFPEKGDINSRADIMNGIKTLEAIGKRQEETVLPNGLMQWEDSLLDMTKTLNGTVMVGYNIDQYDIPQLNKTVTRIWNKLDEKSKVIKRKQLGLEEGASPMITGDNGVLDMYSALLAYMSGDLTRSSFYTPEQASKIFGGGHTLLQQESILDTFFEELKKTDNKDLAAHAAKADAVTSMGIAQSSLFENVMKKLTSDKDNNIKDINFNDLNIGSVFLMKGGGRYTDNNKKNAFDFEIDKVDNVIRTAGGLVMDEDGNVKHTDKYNRYHGIAKDTVYSISNITRTHMGKTGSGAFKDLDQSLESNYIYSVKLTPRVDKSITRGNPLLENEVVLNFGSKRELEAYFSNNSLMLGQINPKTGNMISSMSDKEQIAIRQSLGRVVYRTDKYGKKFFEHQLAPVHTAQELLDYTTTIASEMRINETAGRSARNNSYYKRSKEFALKRYLDDAGITNPQKQQDAIVNALLHKDDNSLPLTYDKLFSFLAEQDTDSNGIPIEGSYNLSRGSLNNTIGAWINTASIADKGKIVMDELEGDETLSYYDKQNLYGQIMDRLYDIGRERNADNDNHKRPRWMYAKDNNYVEIKLPSSMIKDESKFGVAKNLEENPDILRVNLQSNEQYNLVNKLLKSKLGDTYNKPGQEGQREANAKQVLNEFINTIYEEDPRFKDDEDYKDFMKRNKNFIDKGTHSKVIAADFIETLNKMKDKDEAFGVLKDTVVHNVLEPEAVLDSITKEDILNVTKSFRKGYNPIKVLKASKNDMDFENFVNDFVDKYAMPNININGNMINSVVDVANYAAEENGFTDRTRDLFIENLAESRRQYVKGYSALFKGILDNGGNILFDQDNKRLGVDFKNGTYFFNKAPRTAYFNNSLWLMSGNQPHANSFKLFVKQALRNDGREIEPSKVEASTIVKNAMDEFKFASKNIKRARDYGESEIEAVKRMISDAGKEVSLSSGMTSLSPKEIRAWGNYDMSDMASAIPALKNRIKSYEYFTDPKVKNILLDSIDSIVNGKDMSPALKEALTLNGDQVYRMVVGLTATEENPENTLATKLLANVNPYIKENLMQNLIAQTGQFTPRALGAYDNAGRPPTVSDDQIMHARKHVQDIIEKHGYKGIKVGNKLVTQSTNEDRMLNGVSSAITDFTVNAMSISTEGLHLKFREALDKAKTNPEYQTPEGKKKLEFIKSYLSMLSTTEQERLMSQELADIIFENAEDQRIITTEKIIHDRKIAGSIISKHMENALPIMQLKDGKISFRYSKGDYVRQGEALLSLDSYRGKQDYVGAKEKAGFFTSRFYSKATKVEVSAEEVSKILNENRKSISIDENGNINFEDVLNLLKSKGIEHSYVNKTSFLKGAGKTTINTTEKGHAMSFGAGLGTFDKRLNKVMEKLDRADNLGLIYKDIFEEEVTEQYNKSDANIKAELKKLGFNSAEDIVKSMREEKYMVSNFINNEVFPGQNISIYTQDLLTKHGNKGNFLSSYLHTLAGKYQEENGQLSEEEAYDKALNFMKSTGLFDNVPIYYDNRTGNIVHASTGESPDETLIFKGTEVLDALEKEMGDYGRVRLDSPKEVIRRNGKKEVVSDVGQIYKVAVQGVEDFSGVSHSINGLEDLKADIKKLRAERLATTDTAKADELNDRIINLEAKYKGLSGLDKHFKIGGREIEVLSQYGYKQNYMSALEKKYGEKDYKQYFGHLLGVNGKLRDEYNDADVYKTLVNDLNDQMDLNTKENAPYIHSAKVAEQFNAGIKKGEELKKGSKDFSAFKEIDINDLVIPSDEYEDNLKFDQNSYYQNALLINTGVKGERYSQIAIPKTNYEDEESAPITKSLQRMRGSYARLQRAKNNAHEELSGDKTLVDYENDYKESILNVKDAIEKNTKSYMKNLQTVRLKGNSYSYQKASLVAASPDAALPFDMLNISMVGDKTLAEWAKEGVIWDSSWVSPEEFENRGYFKEDTLKRFGFTNKEQMMDYLEKYGTMDLEERTPAINEGSIKPTRVFLKRNMPQNVRKSFDTSALARNQDQDGDNILSTELAYSGVEHSKTPRITYAEYLRNKQRGIKMSSTVDKYYTSIEAGQAYRAGLINPKIKALADEKYGGDLQKAIDEINPKKMLGASKNNLNGYEVTPVLSTNISTDKIIAAEDRVKSLAMDYIKENPDADIPNDSSKFKILTDYALKTDSYDKYKGDLHLLESAFKAQTAMINKTAGKASIGEINMPLYSFRRMGKELGVSRENRELLQAFFDKAEQGIISKKKSDALGISAASDFAERTRNLVLAKDNSIQMMQELLEENPDVVQNAFDTAKTFGINDPGKDIGEFKTKLTSAFEEYYNIARNNSETSKIYKALNVSSILTGENAEEIFNGFNYAKTSTFHRAGLATGKKYATEGASEAIKRAIDRDTNDTAKNTASSMHSSNMGKITDEIADMISKAKEQVKDTSILDSKVGAGLALGAVGLAGAIMMMGYIGGRPNTPDNNQTADDNDSLQDSDMTVEQLPDPMSTNRGYVININAESPKGRKHAEQALQKAMYSSLPSDVNISMNVTDGGYRPNSRLIDKFLAGVL